MNIWQYLTHFHGHCPFCGQTHRSAGCCAACRAELPWNDCACVQCGTPLTDADRICGHCLQTPPPFDRAVCAFRYEFPVNRLLIKLKFHARLSHARSLGALLANRVSLAHEGPWPEVILPVPLHQDRLRQRGFNQATEIARVVGKKLGIPVLTRHCERQRNTVPQSSLSAHARQQNIHQAFALRSPLPARHVAIVDDIVTTGATVGELAGTLLAAGTESVVVWSVARA